MNTIDYYSIRATRLRCYWYAAYVTGHLVPPAWQKIFEKEGIKVQSQIQRKKKQ